MFYTLVFMHNEISVTSKMLYFMAPPVENVIEVSFLALWETLNSSKYVLYVSFHAEKSLTRAKCFVFSKKR